MSSIILITGIPAAGKSTLSERLYNFYKDNNGYNPYVYSFDDYITSNWRNHQEMPSAKSWRKSWETHVFDEITTSVNGKSGVKDQLHIIDDIFYLQSQRKPFQRYSLMNKLKFCTLKMVCSTDECIERNKLRECIIPGLEITEDIIINVNNKFENDKDMIFVNVADDITDIVDRINKILNNYIIKEYSNDSDKNEPAELTVSQINDIKSREITGSIIKSGYQKHGKFINDLRRLYMNNIFNDNEFNDADFKNYLLNELNKK